MARPLALPARSLSAPPEPHGATSVLVAESEPLARRRLRRLLGAERDVCVVGECASDAETVAAVRAQAPQVLFLGVRAPALDGFSVLDALAPHERPVVVVLAEDERDAARAYQAGALDYVLKPPDAKRLRLALGRALHTVATACAAREGARLRALLEQLARGECPPPGAVGAAAGTHGERAARDRLMVRDRGRVLFVRTAEIDWIEAAGNYVRLYVGRRTHLVRESMSALEATLDEARFARIHRSAIVNLDRVREMQPWFSGEYVVLLHDGRQLKLSRWYRERLERRMGRG